MVCAQNQRVILASDVIILYGCGKGLGALNQILTMLGGKGRVSDDTLKFFPCNFSCDSFGVTLVETEGSSLVTFSRKLLIYGKKHWE